MYDRLINNNNEIYSRSIIIRGHTYSYRTIKIILNLK